MMGYNQYSSLLERFERSISPEPNSGCWLWTGFARVNKNRKNDVRGVLRVGGRNVLAYRVSYQIHKGDIPCGSHICHTCDTPLCVNPEHLYAGNASSNALDSLRRGRHRTQRYPEQAADIARRMRAALSQPPAPTCDDFVGGRTNDERA